MPDSASVGQHLHDLASALVARGKRVVVLTPRGGYDDNSFKYPWRETIDGVEVWRLPICSFGKRPIFLRLLGGISLSIQSMLIGLFIKKLSYILVSTAPPMSGISARVIRMIKGTKIIFWAMDINPDQMIVSGRLRADSLFARISSCVNKAILRGAEYTVTMDSFMKDRLNSKHNDGAKEGENIIVIPPWPYENQFATIAHENNYFRKSNGWKDKFVVMYSGNISIVHPIKTLLEAMVRLKNEDNIVFVFIGGKAAREEISEFVSLHKLHNVQTLPYVPLAETQYSLSAADLHVVVMGDNMVGIVHPCKVYGIMSVGRPFIAIGPEESHLGDILNEASIGWLVRHGDVDGVVRRIRNAASLDKSELKKMGEKGQDLVKRKYSRKVLSGKFCELFDC